jgi:hypothetical protein
MSIHDCPLVQRRRELDNQFTKLEVAGPWQGHGQVETLDRDSDLAARFEHIRHPCPTPRGNRDRNGECPVILCMERLKPRDRVDQHCRIGTDQDCDDHGKACNGEPNPP